MYLKQLALTAAIMTSLLFVFSGATAEEKRGHEHEHEHRQHDSHVHGIAAMNLVLEGDEVHIELESPAANIVGFEHTPYSEADHAALDKAVAMLKDGGKLFEFNESAGCSLEKSHIESALLKEEHEHEEGHSDIDAVYHFECANPGRLTQLSVVLFDAFPGMEKLDVQYVIDNRQGANELTATSHVIKF